jgi:spore coat protein A
MLRTDGRLIHEDNSHSGTYGDIVTVNGKPWPAMPVERRKYRFRILNGSISRSYRFALSTGEPVTFIGTDGGLMPAPQQAASWRHAPAERYEVVIDFSKYKIGQRVVLKNLEPPNNVNYDTTKYVMAFDVVSEPTSLENNEVPSVLNPEAPMMDLVESQAEKERHFKFERQHGHWMIDGTIWQDVVDSGYTKVLADPELNSVEVWEFQNPSGGWFHPIHVHRIDFKVLSRNGRPPFPWEKGPKDVVYLGENETVRMIARFGPQVGRYMIHCHNLPHEDHDMMHQFRVGTDTADNDPMTSDPATAFPL